MPLQFPFFRAPYPYRIYQPKYPSPYIQTNRIIEKKRINEEKKETKPEHKSKTEQSRNCMQKNTALDATNNIFTNLFSFIPTSIGPLNFHPEALSNNELPLFEMFGIRLFLDDIIIICILIFLYQEEVTDQMLYISLFLLLIS